MTWRLGCDIGGTFTDFVLLDEATGAFTVEKVLTTPADPSEAVDDGVGKLLARHPGFVTATEHVIHGTTLVINAVIERKGARTAVIATRGFADILEMRRERGQHATVAEDVLLQRLRAFVTPRPVLPSRARPQASSAGARSRWAW